MGRETAPQEVRAGMTDTEMLDYLQQSLTMNARRMPCDVQIGSVFFTINLRPGTLRELIGAAIVRDKQDRVDHITRKLELLSMTAPSNSPTSWSTSPSTAKATTSVSCIATAPRTASSSSCAAPTAPAGSTAA